MLFTRTTFIGIDPTAGEKPFTYVVLDSDRKLLALGHGGMEDVVAYAAGQQQAYIAVCGPRRVNSGQMALPEVRSNLFPPPHPGRWENFRVAEYLLRIHNLSAPQTPSQEHRAPKWMRSAFNLFRRLDSLGYRAFSGEEAEKISLEVYPYACFAALIGVIPFPKYTLEGRIQRQLILHVNKVDVPDPFNLFEEITRHKLLKGILPTQDLYSPGELDALAAAYTAWAVALQPEGITMLGDPGEGQVILPVAELKSRY